jgi:5S rRNA maturation endonuclease (ribonuclease M5)
MKPEEFLLKLEGAHEYRDGWRAKCPAHNGNSNTSLSIKQADSGAILIHCFGGCRNEDIVASINLELKDLFSGNSHPLATRHTEETPPPQKRPIEKVYNYVDESGKTKYQTVKFADGLKPRFLQRKAENIWNIQGVKRILYRLPEVMQASEVCICEGEKDADKLCSMGFTGSTNPMGAGTWDKSYAQTLQDKDVFIFADNDEAGKDHANTVARSIGEVANSVKMVEIPGLKPKQDVWDYIARFKNPERAAESIARLMESAPSWSPVLANPLTVQPVDDLLEEDLPDNWQVVGFCSEEECGFIAGGSKGGKSIMAQNLAMSMAAGHRFLNTFDIVRPLKVLYLNLEISKKNFQRRFQRMKDNCEFTYPRENLIHITEKGLRLDDNKTFEHLKAQVAHHRPDVIILDCLYMAVEMDYKKLDGTIRFLKNLSDLIRDYKCSVILVHHYRKQSQDRKSPNYGTQEMWGSFLLNAFGDFYMTFKQDYKNRNKLTLDFVMRNCEEPDNIIAIRNPETLWYEYGGLKGEEKTRGGAAKGTVWNVVDTLKKHGDGGEMDNPDLKAMLEKELEISDKTARNLISQAKVEKYVGPIDPKARPVRWRILVGN